MKKLDGRRTGLISLIFFEDDTKFEKNLRFANFKNDLSIEKRFLPQKNIFLGFIFKQKL